jgi:hypothetical protein
MVNTRLEATLEGIHEDTLEQLADDLLLREGYEVEPTSTSGPDNERDALVLESNQGENGIVHCSINKKIQNKIWDDADKVAKHDTDYDFFIFVTNQDRATVMRDRLEEEISEEYGFRTRIWDFEHLRNKLMGNPDNHDLARTHLSVDPAGMLQKVHSKLDRLESQEDLRRLQNQPRINIDSWEVTEHDELVPLMAPRSLERTQQLLHFNLSNVGEGNAYNLRFCLFVKPIDDLSSPPIDEIREEFFSAESTSKLRREGRDPERSPQNHLESSESAEFMANTFIYMNGKQGNAFSVDTTGPFAPGVTPPDGFAVGLKLIYDDNFEDTHEKPIFSAIGGVPSNSLRDFFMNMRGIIKTGENDVIYPEEIHFG